MESSDPWREGGEPAAKAGQGAEEAFDPELNPIRAKVSLGMRVLNPNDFGFEHQGGNLFITYQQQLEKLATLI